MMTACDLSAIAKPWEIQSKVWHYSCIIQFHSADLNNYICAVRQYTVMRFGCFSYGNVIRSSCHVIICIFLQYRNVQPC